jgi:hypothetical protein
MKAAEDLYESSRDDVTKATIILSPAAGKGTVLHELGHIEQALNDPLEFEKQQQEAENAPNDGAYRNSESEKYAERFADYAGKRSPDPPQE